MTAEEYRNYLETDFDDVDLKELKDIRKIRIDRNQTKEKKNSSISQTGGKSLSCLYRKCKSENKVWWISMHDRCG